MKTVEEIKEQIAIEKAVAEELEKQDHPDLRVQALIWTAKVEALEWVLEINNRTLA